MKFAVVVVLVALALGVNSSVLPIGWPGTVVVGNPHAALTLTHGPLVQAISAPGSLAVHAAAVPAVHAVHDIHGIHGIHGLHGAIASPVQIVSGPHVASAIVAPIAPVATAVSKTRGAVHVAPLPGHTQSVVSANLQPAPGTL